MLKKLVLIAGLLLLLLALGVVWGTYYFSPKAERVLDFIKKYPQKSAFMLLYNGEVVAQQNADTIMPLASAVKTIIAIEFSFQAASGIIDTASLVDTHTINRYYIPETDGGAHRKWLSTLHPTKQLNGQSVSLMQVAKGMMHYSSNANASYLMDVLGLHNINSRLVSLGLVGHQQIYPYVAAMLVCMVPQGKDYNSHLNQLYMMNMQQYTAACLAVHEQMKNSDSLKNTFYTNGLDMKIQKVWSTRLPGGSCNMYASLMQRLNNREFGDSVHAYLNPLMERLLDSQNNANWLSKAGKKGGSTAYVITETLYATDTQNNQVALAVFFNNLTIMQNLKLQMSMNEFDLQLIQNPIFREKVKQKLNHPQ